MLAFLGFEYFCMLPLAVTTVIPLHSFSSFPLCTLKLYNLALNPINYLMILRAASSIITPITLLSLWIPLG